MSKQFKLGIIACVIIGLGFVGYAVFKKQGKKDAIVQETPSQVSNQEQLFYAQQLEKAQTDLDKAQTDKEKIDANSKKAEALFYLGKLNDALITYQQILKIDAENASAYTDMFDVQIAMNDYKGAEESIKKAISLNTNSTRWKKYIAFQKDQLKYTNDQLDKSYNDALTDTKDDVDVVIAYAQFLESAGNNQKAMEQWQKAGTIKPEKKADYDAEIARIQSKG